MADDRGLMQWIEELLESIGVVTSRAMMGGRTLYLDGTVFAILDEEAVWFKADKGSDAEWDALGAPRFIFTFGDGRTGSMNYRLVPETALDDAEEFRRLALLAQAAGERAPAGRRKRT